MFIGLLEKEEMEASEEDETERDRRLAVEAQDREFARVLQVRNSPKVIIEILEKIANLCR
jgi:hypothetical protein